MSDSLTAGRLDVTVERSIATITITNTRKRNVMTAQMWLRLPELLDRLADDPGVRALVLRGAGDTFCAGADLTDIEKAYAGGEDSIVIRAEQRLATFPRPTIAEVAGFCIGGGCQLAIACDIRIVAESALFGVPPAKLGIVYPAAATRRLVELVGPSTAKHLLFSGDPVDAHRAARVGLVDEVVPAGQLTDRVDAFAAVVASRSPVSVAAAKEFVNQASRREVDPERIAYWHEAGARSGDLAEGLAAFRERRQPRF